MPTPLFLPAGLRASMGANGFSMDTIPGIDPGPFDPEPDFDPNPAPDPDPDPLGPATGTPGIDPGYPAPSIPGGPTPALS